MSQIKSSDDIKQLGTILSVWAHPDDESFCCAGIMAAAIRNGQTVACVTATKGEAGVQDESRWPAYKLGEIRTQEIEAAMEHIGIKDHHWLGYRDGHCQEIEASEAAARIKGFIDKYKPDTILTFGPEGLTGHPDHKTVSQWVELAALGTDVKVFHNVEEKHRYQDHMAKADKDLNIYFNIDKPPIYEAGKCDIAYQLPDDILDQKRQSLKVQVSQTERLFKTMPAESIAAMLAAEYFVAASR